MNFNEILDNVCTFNIGDTGYAAGTFLDKIFVRKKKKKNLKESIEKPYRWIIDDVRIYSEQHADWINDSDRIIQVKIC